MVAFELVSLLMVAFELVSLCRVVELLRDQSLPVRSLLSDDSVMLKGYFFFLFISFEPPRLGKYKHSKIHVYQKQLMYNAL